MKYIWIGLHGTQEAGTESAKATTSEAARRFLEANVLSPDLASWERILRDGFSEQEREALLGFCAAQDDIGIVFAEVMRAIEGEVRRAGGQVPKRSGWTDINQETLIG